MSPPVELGGQTNSDSRVISSIVSYFLGNYDLHRLWYVLLKEKNRLHGDRLLALQLNQQFDVHNNLKKVRLSMKRLQTVVSERRQLRDKYRRYLEEQYIQQRKNEELEEKLQKVRLFVLNFQRGFDTSKMGEIVYDKHYG